MSLLERPLPRWGKWLSRLPLVLYRLGLGRLLGHRFLVVVHRGRRSGRLYQTVLEVVRWDPSRREAVVASGWGEQANWYRNLRAAPATEVWLSGKRFVPEERFLDLDERVELLRGYQGKHPWAARAIGPLLGLGAGEEALVAAAKRLPMVSFTVSEASLLKPSPYLTAERARHVYDRIGRFQDLQTVYEHRATKELLAHGDFEHAAAVFELGYGTGAFAARLLERHLPRDSRYVGVDVSPRMHGLALRRLGRYGGRAQLRLSDGSLRFSVDDESFDRFVAVYVLDLLGPDDTRLVLDEARRLLVPGGLLCLASLTPGSTGVARLVTATWQALWSFRPEIVGGCRPVRITDYLDGHAWALRQGVVVTTLGVSSEVVVAAKR
jgi:deazaflavin-dependent oxidoreductase (nitroreductase family)